MGRPNRAGMTSAVRRRCAVALAIAIGLAAVHFAAREAQAALPLHASPDASLFAVRTVTKGDNGGLPFAIVDKPAAMVFAFDPKGRLLGAAPALLGLARGDRSPPGIGDRKLATITPQERITPAGRFVAVPGRNLAGKDILWVDYDAAISLHPVVTANIAEHRLHRLATPSAADNRISYGCINVPAAFFADIVGPLFRARGGIVYILPDTLSIASVFFDPAPSAGAAPEAQAGTGGER